MNDVLPKQEALLDWFCPFPACIVAFSGGLDSSVVAKAASLVLGESAMALMATSPTCFQGEADQAKSVADAIAIRFISFESGEMRDPVFVANGPQRCFDCKRIRFGAIRRFADEQGIELVVDGSNADDQDDYRPGRRAVEEFAIRSPLLELGIDKSIVRQLARLWKLPNCEIPASPCLATRIAYGQEITETRLRQIESAEQCLTSLGCSPLRVRFHANELARIEVPVDQLDRVLRHREEILRTFQSLGFRLVTLDLEGFRSGSMNLF